MIFMTIKVVLAVAVMFVLAEFFSRYFRKRDVRPIPIEEIFVFLNRVYTGELLKLVEILEEMYERKTHTRAEFMQIQAWRIEKLRECFKKLAGNGAALHRYGYRHLAGDDPMKRVLAKAVVNYAVPVKIYARGSLLFLFACRRLLFLDGILFHIQLPIMRHLVQETLAAYKDLKVAALMFARHSDAGIEVKLAARL